MQFEILLSNLMEISIQWLRWKQLSNRVDLSWSSYPENKHYWSQEFLFVSLNAAISKR